MCLGLWAGQKNVVPASCFTDSHDITTLPVWGPYSKRYAGISHIPDMAAGMRFDFTVLPGYYRNRVLVPHVLFESSYYPWNVHPSMKRLTYRYELEWKDRVFVDVTYQVLDSLNVLVEMRCVNHTPIYQNLVLNLMAYLDYEDGQPRFTTENPSYMQRWHKATDYQTNEPVRRSPQYNLVYDGWKRNEDRSSESLSGFVISKGFARTKGDRITYVVDVPSGREKGVLTFRHHTAKGKTASFRLKGLSEGILKLQGTGEFSLTAIPYSCDKVGKHTLELLSEGTAETTLDGFFLTDAQEATTLRIAPRNLSFVPEMTEGASKQDFILKYTACDSYYGVAWNCQDSEIRTVWDDNLESYFRKKMHDHVSKRLVGNKKGHYADAFLRPIVISPQSEDTLRALITVGAKSRVAEQIRRFHDAPQSYVPSPLPASDTEYLPEGKKYALGHQLLQAALLSNLVYPVHTQGQYIRHFTPGKNWNSLYTWDSGFIASGLIDVDVVKAFECIRAYTTPVGSESAFIHHGTPLPIQLFAFHDLWNNTQSEEALRFLYPRLKQFFDFMVGENPSSTTRMKGSGLLRTWDYFYNSGGWDDYPPQKALRDKASVTPVVSSAYYIRAAKILRRVASVLGMKKDIKVYDECIARLSRSLLDSSWDEASGYFGYVVHDAQGDAKDIYRYTDGSNFNKGMDGVSPLVAGIASDEQNRRMMDHVFSPQEMWTPVGISTVDQSAAYYSSSGYWNGAVWFPHQWLLWKAMLDLGEGEKAFRIAQTALGTWEKECEESYYTFEHFIISSQRGAGWHQFSGLSSPLLGWFTAYHRVGKVSAGFEVWIADGNFSDDHTSYEARLLFDDSSAPHRRTLLVCMNPSKTYQASFNGKGIAVKTYYPGMMEIELPATNKSGTLIVAPESAVR